MNSLGLSIKNLFAKPLNTALSLILLAFGVGIISFMILINKQLTDQFQRNIHNIDFVLGAKGSPLQLILSSVYQVDAPTGNINYSEVKKLLKKQKVLIEYGVPMAFGDNYRGFRIVGTDTSYIRHYELKIAEGKFWEKSLDATIGYRVAEKLKIGIGDTFFSSHGLAESDDVHDNATFTVVGILEPSGTVADQLILTSIEALWSVHGLQDLPEEEQEITSVLLKKRSVMANVMLPNILKDSKMQIAMAASEKNRLEQNFGIGKEVVNWLARIIIFISFISVFISLYNSLKERRYELAVLRAMGATQIKLFTIIILEGLVLGFIGLLIGLALGRTALYFMNASLEKSFHYDILQLSLLPEEWLLAGATLLVGITAALIPALQSIRIDISKTLSEA
ncbi:MAG: ABC transporter permease [Flavobacteriales bacterium]